MYISYKSTNYPCGARVGATMVYTGLPEDFPAPVDSEMILYRDDGFELRRDDPGDYLRQTFEGGVLTLTNEPEPTPGPEPEPEEPEPDLEERVTVVEEDVAALTAAVEKGLSL